MQKITFGTGKNATTIPVISIVRGKEPLRGSEREIINIFFDADSVNLTDLLAVASTAEKTNEITAEFAQPGEEAPVTTTTFTGYIVPGEPVLGVGPAQNAPDIPEEVTSLAMVKLGKLTYIEEQLQKLGVNPLG